MTQTIGPRSTPSGAIPSRANPSRPIRARSGATPVTWLTATFAIAPQISAADVAGLARSGFRAIIAVRPDGEDAAAAPSRQIARAAKTHGVTFRYAPVASHALTEAGSVEAFEVAIAGTHGPVLAYCKSGTRAAIVWALAAARYQPADCVGEVLRKAGVDPDLIADELNEQHRKPGVRPAPLVVECPTSSAA